MPACNQVDLAFGDMGPRHLLRLDRFRPTEKKRSRSFGPIDAPTVQAFLLRKAQLLASPQLAVYDVHEATLPRAVQKE